MENKTDVQTKTEDFDIFLEMPVFWIQPDDFQKPKSYTVEAIEIETTQWGKKAIFNLKDEDKQDFKISSWNLAMQKKTNIKDLLHKKIMLSPFSEKKLLLVA